MKRLAILPLLALAACESPQPPAACGPIPQVTVNAGETAAATACFNDPNGDALVYSATSSNPGVATVSMSGTAITIAAIAPGGASVTVTASDPGGLEAQQILQVLVPNRAPQPRGTMPSLTVPVGRTEPVDASSYFAEPDGETLAYSATSSNPAVATVSVSGTVVSVAAAAKGGAVVIVTATDPGGLAATQSFQVTVPNRAPVAGNPIADIEVFVGDAAEVDASGHFSDPDGDPLAYGATTSDPAVAAVSVSGSTVSVEALSQGRATVTVTATDPEGLSVASSFEVTSTHRDREVLVALYNATDGPNWRDNTNWLTDKPLGEWYGVDTDASGRVVRLDLAGEWNSDDGEYVSHGLSGPIPPELGDLGNLEYLNLGENDLTGSIPPQLGDLSNLDTLAVYANSLTGAIPSELGDLPDLEVLWLGNNSLTGTVPPELGDLPDLEVLWLNANSLTGTVPPELGDLGNLEYLNLGYNDLTGSIPPELGDLTNLTELWLSSNQLTGSIPPELGNLPDLEVLWLGDNSLTGTVPPELGDLGNLEYLNLGYNDLTGSIPPELGDLGNLKHLDLGDNDLTGSIPPELGNLSIPWYLSLSSNGLTGEIPNSFLTLKVRWLYFGDNDGLCAPNTAAFTRWLNQIEYWSGPRCESFDFDMRFTGAVSSTVRSRLGEARDEWELVLRDTELGDIRVNRTLRCLGISGYVGTVDDHMLFAHVDSIDGEGGILAVATYCYRRTSDGSPLLSATVIDEDDIEELADEDALVPVAFHEMGHALGFPGYWFYNDLVDTLDADDPHFEGELAIEAFDDAGGDDYDGEKVPIQLRVYGHWRESVFGDEIMSPTMRVGTDKLPVSAITLQSFADVGYEVDVSRADDYELPGGTAKRPGGEAVFDLGNDVVWGPVVVLDTDGRVVRVIPPPRGTVGPSLPRRDVRVEPRRPPEPGSAASGSVRPPLPRPEELDLIKKPRRPPVPESTPPGSGSESG